MGKTRAKVMSLEEQKTYLKDRDIFVTVDIEFKNSVPYYYGKMYFLNPLRPIEDKIKNAQQTNILFTNEFDAWDNICTRALKEL